MPDGFAVIFKLFQNLMLVSINISVCDYSIWHNKKDAVEIQLHLLKTGINYLMF
jgi:hypothetical protein